MISERKTYISNYIIYRSILFQPQNLVMMGTFPECEVKLCDFEISRVILEGTEVREILGTPDYVGKQFFSMMTIFIDLITNKKGIYV